MELSEAIELIEDGVPRVPGTWADLGAGQGLFTRALASLLGSGNRVIAVDRDPRRVSVLNREAGTYPRTWAEVDAIQADIHDLAALRTSAGEALAGVLIANALHFSSDPGRVLAQAAGCVHPGGRLLVVEYDGRPASPWVPFPLPLEKLGRVAAAAGLSEARVLGQRPSRYGGIMYCASLQLLDGSQTTAPG